MKINHRFFLVLLLITFGLTIGQPVLGKDKYKTNPFSGYWKSENGSIVKIDEDQGILVDTHSNPWKKYIDSITIKDIHSRKGTWVATEWLITHEGNFWVEAAWELSDKKIKRTLLVKGKSIETYFDKINKNSQVKMYADEIPKESQVNKASSMGTNWMLP